MHSGFGLSCWPRIQPLKNTSVSASLNYIDSVCIQGRARQLYAAGFRTLGLVAHADPGHLVRSVEHLTRKSAAQIVASAQVCAVSLDGL
jgi:hypothetical protein